VRTRAVCLLTFTRNSAKELNRLLRSISDYVDEIVVVDGCSTDGTVEVAERFGAKVYRRRPWGYPDPDRMFAVRKCRSEWILYLDTDEIPSRSLMKDLHWIISQAEARGIHGFLIKRYDIINGELALHAQPHPGYQLRLYRRDRVLYRGIVHELPVIQGNVEALPDKYYIMHLLNDISFSRYMKKRLNYARYASIQWPRNLHAVSLIKRAILKILPISIYLLTLRYIALTWKNNKYLNMASLKNSFYLSTDDFLLELMLTIRSRKRRKLAEIVYKYGFIQLLGLDRDDERFKCR